MNISLERVVKAKIPKLKFEKQFWDQVAQVVEGNTLQNITQQKTRKGGRIKRNAKSTRERKRKAGRPQLSLVDKEHRFTKGKASSWKVLEYLHNGRGIVIGGATAELRKLVEYVTAKGYVGWLGLSAEGIAALRALVRKEIVDQFRKAKRGL